jgi:hypothetical protein
MAPNRQKTMIIAAHLPFFGTSRAFEVPNEREMLIATASPLMPHPGAGQAAAGARNTRASRFNK